MKYSGCPGERFGDYWMIQISHNHCLVPLTALLSTFPIPQPARQLRVHGEHSREINSSRHNRTAALCRHLSCVVAQSPSFCCDLALVRSVKRLLMVPALISCDDIGILCQGVTSRAWWPNESVFFIEYSPEFCDQPVRQNSAGWWTYRGAECDSWGWGDSRSSG